MISWQESRKTFQDQIELENVIVMQDSWRVVITLMSLDV